MKNSPRYTAASNTKTFSDYFIAYVSVPTWTTSGSVCWYLGDKQCPSGKWRTELFIHSQGLSDDADGITNGCIEIGQGARSTLAFYNRVAYDDSNGRTTVSNA